MVPEPEVSSLEAQIPIFKKPRRKNPQDTSLPESIQTQTQSESNEIEPPTYEMDFEPSNVVPVQEVSLPQAENPTPHFQAPTENHYAASRTDTSQTQPQERDPVLGMQPNPGPSSSINEPPVPTQAFLDELSQWGKICTVCKAKFKNPKKFRCYGAIICESCRYVARRWRENAYNDVDKCDTSKKMLWAAV